MSHLRRLLRGYRSICVLTAPLVSTARTASWCRCSICRMSVAANASASHVTRRSEDARGSELETCFRFAREPGGACPSDEADVKFQGTELLRLIYAPAATLLRVNHGWRLIKSTGLSDRL